MRLNPETPARQSFKEALRPVKRKLGRPPMTWITTIQQFVQLESVIDNINSDIRSSGLDDKIDTGMTADPNIGYSIIHDVIEKTKMTRMTSKLVKYNKN